MFDLNIFTSAAISIPVSLIQSDPELLPFLTAETYVRCMIHLILSGRENSSLHSTGPGIHGQWIKHLLGTGTYYCVVKKVEENSHGMPQS